MASPIRIGVSSCLLGNRVRYDRGHKQDSLIVDTLGNVFELIPVCPEVAIGMGVPRPPIQLVGDLERPRALVVNDSKRDITAPLTKYAKHMTRELTGISGYIFKSKSPSCGIHGVKVHTGEDRPRRRGVGIFAREFVTREPILPVEDEARLALDDIRENFLERVFSYRRWQDLIASGLTRRKLADFHAAHRLTLMAHGNPDHQALQQLAIHGKGKPPGETARSYARVFMRALKRRATRRRHERVLTHLMGYLAGKVKPNDKVELRESLNGYRSGTLPLIIPITLLNHHLRNFPQPDITNQVYLNPSPQELMLRYHV